MFTAKYATPEAKAQARSIRRKVRQAKKSGNAAELAKWQAALLALQTVPATPAKDVKPAAPKADDVKAEPDKTEVKPAPVAKPAQPAVIHPAPKPAPKPGKKTAKK